MLETYRRLPTMVFLLVAVCAVAHAAPKLDVQDVVWNFDGGYAEGRINLVTVVLLNAGDQPYSGVVTLQRATMGVQKHGLPQVAQVGLAPGGRRIVQFFVYGNVLYTDFTVSWQGGAYDFSAPMRELDVASYLQPSGYRRRLAGMPAFPAEWFPPTVAGTEALELAVLDHVPRWSPAQQQALLDWVHGGGVLVLTRGRSEDMPTFSGVLTALNDPSDRFQLGAGLVVRVPRSTVELDAKAIAAQGVPVLSPGGEAPSDMASEEGYYEWAYRERLEEVFANMRMLVAPDHNWGVMFWVLLGFTLFVSLGNYMVARRGSTVRAVLFFCVVLGLASWALSIVGRRGYGEVMSASTVAVARPLGGDRWDVTHISDLFVTSSDRYSVPATGEWDVFLSPTENPVSGAAFNGGSGGAVFQLPLYSHGSLLHRTVVDAPGPTVSVVTWPWGDGLAGLRVAVDMADGAGDSVRSVAAVRGGEASKLGATDRGQFAAGEDVTSTWDYMSHDDINYPGYMPGPAEGRWESVTTSIVSALIVRAEPFRRPVQTDVIDLFLDCGEAPAPFRLNVAGFEQEKSRIIYHVRLRRPEEPNNE